jgi:5'-3' exonuclease
VKLYLLDGTYELFRAYYALPSLVAPDGRQVAAVRGLVQTLLTLLRQDGVTHVACAFDHVIESFRNDLFAGYKTGAGVPKELLGQFELAERAAASLGIVVWPMVEFEADDAIATATARWWDAPGMEQVIMCSPDKDLAQMVLDDKVIALDRRRNLALNEAGVIEKFGVSPKSIPDYLTLVGDPADGIPGIPRWGAKTAAAALQHYGHIEHIPGDSSRWEIDVRGAKAIAASLAEHREAALLYKKLATLRLDATITETLDQLEWRGVHREEFQDLCQELGFSRLMELPYKWADA